MFAAINRIIPDKFILVLLATVIVATLLPAKGVMLDAIGNISTAAIVTLFFMHGVKIAPQAVVDGFRRWKLQLAIFLFGYVFMPALGLGASLLTGSVLGQGFALGLIYLAVLPTTVQSSIAYASIARGNVTAAVIASAVSNISGVVLAPLLVGLLASALHSTHGGSGIDVSGIGKIVMILLVPFALGQIARRWLHGWAQRNKALIFYLDRTTIVIAVYVAFSEAVTGGLWSRVTGVELAMLVAVVAVMLAIAFACAWGLGALLGFSDEDRATMLFSGAHKSLATGAPMARILFPGPEAGALLLPLMLYHQLQLMVSAIVSARLARRVEKAEAAVA